MKIKYRVLKEPSISMFAKIPDAWKIELQICIDRGTIFQFQIIT